MPMPVNESPLRITKHYEKPALMDRNIFPDIVVEIVEQVT
jgi:hypothetical protein